MIDMPKTRYKKKNELERKKKEIIKNDRYTKNKIY